MCIYWYLCLCNDYLLPTLQLGFDYARSACDVSCLPHVHIFSYNQKNIIMKKYKYGKII